MDVHQDAGAVMTQRLFFSPLSQPLLHTKTHKREHTQRTCHHTPISGPLQPSPGSDRSECARVGCACRVCVGVFLCVCLCTRGRHRACVCDCRIGGCKKLVIDFLMSVITQRKGSCFRLTAQPSMETEQKHIHPVKQHRSRFSLFLPVLPLPFPHNAKNIKRE